MPWLAILLLNISCARQAEGPSIAAEWTWATACDRQVVPGCSKVVAAAAASVVQQLSMCVTISKVVLPLSLQGMLEEAIHDYTMAVQLAPGHCRAYYNRAFCHDRCAFCPQAAVCFLCCDPLKCGSAVSFDIQQGLISFGQQQHWMLAAPHLCSDCCCCCQSGHAIWVDG